MTMNDRSDGSRVARRLDRLLGRCRDGRMALVGDDLSRSRFGQLATWQSARLAWTHRDLLDSRRYGQAARFFLTDLYGDRDYSARDEGLARVSGLMIKVMPTAALDSIADGLEMHAVTQELDKAMIDTLFDEMALTGQINAANYGEAYRRCDNETGRYRQLTLVTKVGRDLDTIVHKSSIYHLVRMTHYPRSHGRVWCAAGFYRKRIRCVPRNGWRRRVSDDDHRSRTNGSRCHHDGRVDD